MSKSDRTRAQLRSAAIELFDRDGFDRTTVSAIAAAAGVTSMTFFRHFPTKDAVVLDNPFDWMTGCEVLRERKDLSPALRVADAIAWSVRAATGGTGPTGAHTGTGAPEGNRVAALADWTACWRIIGRNSTLRGSLHALTVETHFRLVETLLEDEGSVAPAVAEALVGAALGSILACLLAAPPATWFELELSLVTALTVIADARPVDLQLGTD